MMGFPIRKVTNAARERVYTDMEMWTEVRRRVLNKELSKRARGAKKLSRTITAFHFTGYGVMEFLISADSFA